MARVACPFEFVCIVEDLSLKVTMTWVFAMAFPLSSFKVTVNFSLPPYTLDIPFAAIVACWPTEKLNLTILFISHDLNLVRYLSDKIAVMNKGEIVEFKECDELFENPQDEYTKYLLSSIRKIEIG